MLGDILIILFTLLASLTRLVCGRPLESRADRTFDLAMTSDACETFSFESQ